MEKANYHTHTFRCGHAGGTPLDYGNEAVKKGLCHLGMSDHAPFPKDDHGSRMKFNELDLYCQEVDFAKEELSSKLKIFKALEIEYLPEYALGKNYYEYLLTEKKMDYLVLGEHFFPDKYGKLHSIYNLENEELSLDYANMCIQGMKSGCFKILAHPDLFAYNLTFPWNDSYEKTCDMIIQAAIDTGVILEFNANGLRRGKKSFPEGERFMYPHKRFWEKAKSAGLPALIGSDAHSPEVLWDDAVENAIRIMEKDGIKRIEKLFL